MATIKRTNPRKHRLLPPWLGNPTGTELAIICLASGDQPRSGALVAIDPVAWLDEATGRRKQSGTSSPECSRDSRALLRPGTSAELASKKIAGFSAPNPPLPRASPLARLDLIITVAVAMEAYRANTIIVNIPVSHVVAR
jgi:hypothetical protein